MGILSKSLYDEVNVQGSENICRACSELGIHRIIFTSSVAVYGFAPVGTDESGEIKYFNDYGRTKFLAEEKYRNWLKADSSNSVTIIRPTVIFGEQNRGNVYNLLRQIAGGKFPMVGKGTNRKSMNYVENVAAFIQFCIENEEKLPCFENDFEGTIALRLPEWLAEKETILINGKPAEYMSEDGYAFVSGIFRGGDELRVTLPMKVRAYALWDGKNTYAFKYGPVVLSALLGDREMEKTLTGVDVWVSQNRIFEKDILPSESEVIRVADGTVDEFIENIHAHMERCEDSEEPAFRLCGTDAKLTYVIHYKQHAQRYGLYFKFV